MEPYTPPTYEELAYHCPHCNTYARQIWFDLISCHSHSVKVTIEYRDLMVARCDHCAEKTIWLDGRMIYPITGSAPFPNPDLPNEVNQDYEEARNIFSLSSRGSAALLRLAIERLCDHLKAEGKDLNEKIGSLVEKGLPKRIQQALDSVRVIGNEAVHPGQIDLRDDPEMAAILFELVNIIAEEMITEPSKIKDIYDRLPKSKKEAIEKRNGK